MIEAEQLPLGAGEDAWRELSATLRPFLAKRLRNPADVEDVLQEVFVRIHRGLPSLRDEERFGPWVYRLARNAIADHQRASARHPWVPDGTAPEQPNDVGTNDDDADDGAVARDVAPYAALLVLFLPSPYREALTLTEIEGLSQREAAERLGISVSGLKSRVQRGRRKVRDLLEACCHVAVDARRRIVACEPRAVVHLPDDCCAPSDSCACATEDASDPATRESGREVA